MRASKAGADQGRGTRRWARYGDPKQHAGRTYRGMRVGGTHRWTYPDGEWAERKVAPDRWDVTFTSLKRRKRRAPARSGAETGSGYHWLIVAHQWVEKLDANTYSTQMEGVKSLVAFRKPGWPAWNTQFRNAKRHARERTIAALEAEVARLKAMDDAAFEDPHDAKALPGLAVSWATQEALGQGPDPGRRTGHGVGGHAGSAVGAGSAGAPRGRRPARRPVRRTRRGAVSRARRGAVSRTRRGAAAATPGRRPSRR